VAGRVRHLRRRRPLPVDLQPPRRRRDGGGAPPPPRRAHAGGGAPLPDLPDRRLRPQRGHGARYPSRFVDGLPRKILAEVQVVDE
jgi:hypothetical protein